MKHLAEEKVVIQFTTSASELHTCLVETSSAQNLNSSSSDEDILGEHAHNDGQQTLDGLHEQQHGLDGQDVEAGVAEQLVLLPLLHPRLSHLHGVPHSHK